MLNARERERNGKLLHSYTFLVCIINIPSIKLKIINLFMASLI
jgi:hypothetical protein